MTSRHPKPQEAEAAMKPLAPAEQPTLPVRTFDVAAAAAELRLRIEEINRSVAGLDEAKVVRQEILDLEVSI